MQTAAEEEASTSRQHAANSHQDSSYDCDSDELEALEDAAEEEEEKELDQEVDRAGLIYPLDKVTELLEELKQKGLFQFLQIHVVGKTEVEIKSLFIALGVLLPKNVRNGNVSPNLLVSILKTVLIRHLRQRKKLEQYNTVDDAISLIARSKMIIVLSGSGISTSVGIPDFRSKDGIYAQLQKEGKYNLADPQEMFDKEYFLRDPSCFFSFAKTIFPSNFIPSPSHQFIKLLQDKEVLLRNYTQNIDTLEEAAGIDKVLYCHGSFSQAQCTTPNCDYTVPGSVIKPDIFAQTIPYCPRCSEKLQEKQDSTKKSKKKKKTTKEWENDDDEEEEDDGVRGLGVIKPCITFFGEKLSDEFDKCLLSDRQSVDLLIVMGTSLKVAPVSELVCHIPHKTPVILINKTPVLHMGMDIQLLGDSDGIITYICNQLQWSLPTPDPNKNVVGGQSIAQEISNNEEEKIPVKDDEPKRVGDSHCWLFKGAEADTLLGILERIKEAESDSDSDSEDGPEIEESIESEERGTKRATSMDHSDNVKHQRHL